MMIVGVLMGESLRWYHALTRLAPLPMIVPPIVYLSRPSESVHKDSIRQLQDFSRDLRVQLKVLATRNGYNPDSGIPGFYAAMTPLHLNITELRDKIGLLQFREPFIPTMFICKDGMRSKASRMFCRSIGDSLFDKPLDFQLYAASEDDPQHATIFEHYNEGMQDVFATIAPQVLSTP